LGIGSLFAGFPFRASAAVENTDSLVCSVNFGDIITRAINQVDKHICTIVVRKKESISFTIAAVFTVQNFSSWSGNLIILGSKPWVIQLYIITTVVLNSLITNISKIGTLDPKLFTIYYFVDFLSRHDHPESIIS
jgi:hypothetical protein